jgi:hypothetical protein
MDHGGSAEKNASRVFTASFDLICACADVDPIRVNDSKKAHGKRCSRFVNRS